MAMLNYRLLAEDDGSLRRMAFSADGVSDAATAL
jgi:hypothetical protein